jgi:hypothetical protein
MAEVEPNSSNAELSTTQVSTHSQSAADQLLTAAITADTMQPPESNAEAPASSDVVRELTEPIHYSENVDMGDATVHLFLFL